MIGNATSASTRFSIKRSNPQEYLLDKSPLSPIDTARVEKDYDIVARARENGKKNLPPTEETELSGDEINIEYLYQQIISQYSQYASNVMSMKDQQMEQNKSDMTNSLTRAHVVPTEYDDLVRQKINGVQVDLQKEIGDIRLAQQSLEHFKKENKLIRPAYVTGTWNAVLKVLILAFIIVFEGAANMSLFASNLDSGLAGGFFYAFICAGVNAILCFFIGKYWIIYKNHVKPLLKMCGFLGVIVFFAVIGIMGFGIGHFRDALAVAEAEEAAKVALTSFLDHPFLLKDVFSYLLLGLTFLSGIFAVLDGYHYTDTYPGYAAEELRFNKAQEKWSAFFEDLTQDLNALKDKYIAELHASVGRAQNALKALKTLKLDKEAMLSKYQNAHKNAHAAVKSIVGKYRSENTLARTTPAPAYFRSYDNFNFQNIPNIVAGAEWEEQRTALIKVEDGEIRELSERLRSLENDQEMMEKTIIKAYQDQTGALEAQRQAVFTSNPKFDKNGQDDISSNLFVPTPSL